MRISDWIADVCSSDLTSLSGLDTVILTYDGQRAQRTLPDPLTARVVADEFDASFGYSKMLGDWTFSAKADRSEERGGGQECGRKCSARWWTYHDNKNKET